MAKTTAKKGPKGLIIFTVVFVILLVLLFILTNASKDTLDEGVPDITGQPTEGEVGASVVITEFGDFFCESCKFWNDNIYPQLQADYIDTGKVQFAYVNAMFHQGSQYTIAAAELVQAQYPDAYHDFSSGMYAQQATGLAPATLGQIAAGLIPEVDADAFTAQVQKLGDLSLVMFNEYGLAAKELIEKDYADKVGAYEKKLNRTDVGYGPYGYAEVAADVIPEVDAAAFRALLEENVLAQVEASDVLTTEEIQVVTAITTDSNLIKKFEVNVTPSVMINDKMVPDDIWNDYDGIKKMIDSALTK